LFAGKDEVTNSFKSVPSATGSSVTFTPLDGKTEVAGQLTATVADAAKNVSVASAAVSYTFDNKPPAAAPTAVTVDTKTGVITMSVGSDATTAQLFAADGKNITNLFTVKGSPTGGSVTATPVPGQVDVTGNISIKSADAAGNASTALATQTYTFDNIAPSAPSVAPNSTTGNVVVTIADKTSVAGTVKLLASSSDISGNYVADTSVSGQVTFVPVAGKVGYTNQALTATVADAVGNVSLASPSSPATYTFQNSINITADSASKATGGFPAALANYLFTVDTSTSYNATVTGFGAGDLIVFKGDSVPVINFRNADFTDNRVTIAGTAGSNAVELTLTNLPSGADQQMVGLSNFNIFFGPNSLSLVSNTVAGPSSAQTINDKNFAGPFDAAGSNVAYTISEGTFSSTIANFASGDSIAFVGKGAAASLNFANTNTSDGSVIITGTFDSGAVARLTLNGLDKAADARLFGKDAFVDVFGSGSLAAVGQAGSKAVNVTSASNFGPSGFDASTGDFAFNIGVGEYKTTINGFGSGDSLSFFGSKDATLGIKNTSYTDGVVLVTGLVDGQLVEVTLGVAASLDSKLFGVNAFNDTFGAGSLIA